MRFVHAWVIWVACVLVVAAAPVPTWAQQSAPAPPQLPANGDALPGFVRIAAPVPSSAWVTVAGSLGWGLYSPIGELEGPSQQYSGQLTVGITPWDFLSARLGFRGDYNQHAKDPDAPSSSLYGEPELAVRAQFPLNDSLFLGAEVEARLIGAEAPDVDFGATTPTFRGLFGYNLKKRTWLGAQAGFRWDNSAHALSAIERLRDGDRRTLHASSFDAIELGVAGSHRLGKLELLGEVSTDILVGAEAPRFVEDPISLALGARYDFTPNWGGRLHFEYSPSTAPEPYPDTYLIATRPRFSIGLGVTGRFIERHPPRPQPAQPAAPPAPPPVVVVAPPPPPPPTGKVIGRVVDEGGRPLADVRVSLAQQDEPPVEVFTDAEGQFVFERADTGPSRVTTTSPGFDQVSKELVVVKDEESKLDFTLYASVPAGQVRGRVLDLGGSPLIAQVTVDPGNIVVPLDSSGAFTVDLAPGKYTLRFTLDGYATQLRVVRVQDKGVVVLNIALEK